ncbi:MAG TPA: aldo/keto reductase [Mobilitalea sp.]|nr:aldo/keto reductase [Mobilitalea sp.]
MEYRSIDKLGLKTSLLGFGCMRFPENKDGNIDYEKAEKMIDEAYRNGVNYYDTAYVYHNQKSENFTGKVLDKYDRSSYYLATKLPCWMVNSVSDAERIFEEQLQRLHKDYIDFYLLHSMNKGIFDKMVSLGILEFCEKLKKEGKIKYFGFSFHDEYESFAYISQYRNWDFCQIQLNYMDTDIQAGMKGYELTEKLNIPLIIMEPVKGGSLANLPESVTKYFNEVDPEKSVASWALRWVASLPNVKVVLSGMSDAKQVSDNLNTFNNFVKLSDEEKEAVSNAAIALKKRVKNGCTGCAYCMPCPAGVDIPKNFFIWNNHGIYENTGSTKWLWENDIKDEAKAKNCISCGQCEEICPQKISIREDLVKLQAEIDEALK